MTGPQEDRDGDELVEETKRVASAVQDWLRHTADRAGERADEWASDAADRTTGAPAAHHPRCEYEWCPVCQIASTLQADHPELAARIGEAAGALAGAVRAIVDVALSRTLDPDASPAGPPAPQRRPSPHPRPDGEQGAG